MIRKIININQDKCDGCGLCAKACHEGAITVENGKARLVREDYCDGLGDCLPACPAGAIEIVEREAPVFSKETDERAPSRLNQWPVQIRLVPVKAPYFKDADLLVAADCTAFAHGGFHNAFMKGRATVIGCPKLDDCDYTEKLAAIIKENGVRSVTVARMEVPCCGGLEHAARTALKSSGVSAPLQVVTISADGSVVDND